MPYDEKEIGKNLEKLEKRIESLKVEKGKHEQHVEEIEMEIERLEGECCQPSDKKDEDIVHEMTKTIGRVINEAEDDRIPNDTLWYDDYGTLAERIALEVNHYFIEERED